MTAFEFAHPSWLWGLLLPLLVLLLAQRHVSVFSRLQDFADAHLLPHLLLHSHKPRSLIQLMGMWTLIWTLGILALAGPRWDYEEQEVFRSYSNLMILLDLSDSMRVKDLPQARLEQAMQEIEDILRQAKDLHIGLIGFAGLPHLIAPLSDDYQTLRHLLYEIKIDDIPVQGSQLSLALQEASRWLKGQSDKTSYVLLLSDGEFDATEMQKSVAALPQLNFHLHTLGIGTTQGKEIELADGGWKKDSHGEVILSRLNPQNLQQLASVGKGIYQQASYQQQDTQAILAAIQQNNAELDKDKTVQKLWHERFYLLVIAMMLLLLPWFRRVHLNGTF
jgi:Ca-activated chloride channel family protein